MTPPVLTEKDILFIDNHLIAVNKPAGLPTQSEKKTTPSLLETTREWIKNKFDKPGKVYLGMVHRLDQPVTGVVLFARTSKAASRLSKQFRDKTVRKIYEAAVEGVPQKPEAELVNFLRKEKSLKATVFPREAPDAKEAKLAYKVVRKSGKGSLLEVELFTGRFHQIRAQLSFMGNPIIGDVKYGAEEKLLDGRIALHASRLIINHPITGEEVVIQSPLPLDFPSPLSP